MDHPTACCLVSYVPVPGPDLAQISHPAPAVGTAPPPPALAPVAIVCTACPKSGTLFKTVFDFRHTKSPKIQVHHLKSHMLKGVEGGSVTTFPLEETTCGLSVFQMANTSLIYTPADSAHS